MSSHPKREPSAKNSVSLANLRHTPSQSEVSPRKAVSHEGFQKSTSTSNASSTGSTNSGQAGTTNADTNSGSSGAVSAFSYLKARLFGSVADASTSLTSSARDLLQSKKSSESTKSNQGGDSNDRSTKGGHKAHHHLHQLSEGGGETVTEAFTSPTEPTHTNRLFSRTLPTRRQQPQKPTVASTYTSNGQIPPLPVTNAGVRGDVSDQTNPRARQALVSTSNAHKHLSTGSIIHQEGFLNKKVELHSGESGHGWKVYRVQLKSSKLYFYKPYPTEDRPTFQGPKDHSRHINNNNNNLSPIPYQSHHPQHSSSSILSPRLSISNECGMVLAAFNFESSTRTLLFEGNAKALSHGGMVFEPPVFKYVYGECFTEIDRQTMQFKRHVALLLFEDSVIVCKRKWIRYASTKVKDAIKFTSNSSSNNTSSQSERTDGSVPGAPLRKRQQSLSGISNASLDSKNSIGERSRSSEKQRGYFTKWKHVATYPLSQVEALDMASPVPSSAATFYPFAAPSTAGSTSIGRNSRNSDMSSIYTLNSQPTYVQQTTSTLELVITSLIDGKEFTHRLLFLPPSQEVRHQWYTKFNRAKELQQSKPDFRGRGSFENLSQRDTLSPRSAHSNQSTVSLQSPSSPRSFAESNNFILHSQKMDRARMFCETTVHPELQLGLDDDTGTEIMTGASINGYIHEIVFSNISPVDPKLIPVFATTYQLFAAVPQILKELKRCVYLSSSSDKESTFVTPEQASRIVSLIQGIVRGFNPRIEEPGVTQEIKAFVVDIVQERLKSTDARGMLELIDSTVASSSNSNSQHSTRISEATRRQSAAPSIGSGNPIVDLSNVLITGLTPALFLRLDPVYFAQQVLFYHRHQLTAIGGLECLLSNPAFFMRRYPTSVVRHSVQSPLVFSMYSPHFLTVLITHHILIATQSVQSTSRRPKLLAQWIVTGRACRALGDQSGFMAIAIGVCSPGVVRLQETWKHVPIELRTEVVQQWIPVLIKLDMVTEDLQNLAVSTFALKSTINAIISPSLEDGPTVVPCISNIKMLIDQLDRSMPSFIQASPTPLLNVEKLKHIFNILDKAKKSIKSPHQDQVLAMDSTNANSHLQQYFGHLASISQTLHDQYHSNELSNDAFESSLACEPHFNGQYLDYHYKNRKMTGSFIPLMFPEITTAHRLFPLQLLLSLESTGNTNRKSSFDEANPLIASTICDPREKFQQQQVYQQLSGPLDINTAVSQQPIQGSIEWGESTMTHHGVTHLGMLSSTGTGPKARKRTYSFPPSRVAPRGSRINGAGSQYLINMINPNLDTVAREWLSDNTLQAAEDQNAILVAMQTVAGIGYSLVSNEAGTLLLKVQEDGFDAFAKAVFDEDEATGRPQELLKPTKHWSVNKGSNRSSLSVINSARTVIVKAGTLDMLLQIVVLGLDALAGKYVDERGDLISLVSRPLTLDHGEYVAVFFSTYRSFCTASRLLEQFVAMFTFAYDTKSRKSNIPSGLDLFSNPQATLSHESTTSGNNVNNRKSKEGSMFGWGKVLGLQLRVLKAIEHWLRFHFGDFLDDMALKASLSDALTLMAVQEESQRVLLDDSCASEAVALREQLDLVKRMVVERAMTPVEAPALGSETLETFFGKPPLAEPVLENAWDADSILTQLNVAALGHYLLIRDQEWFVLFEVLESQSADPLGWYLPTSSGPLSDEDVIITGIHNTLYSIRRNGAPGTHWNGERLINSLPMCLQNLCKLHHIIRGWVIAQIANPTLAFEERLVRIQKMLDVILKSRANMRMFGQSLDSSTGSLDALGATARPGSRESRSVPSFVEAAVASALISPESRAYSRAWHEIAVIRKVSVETLEDMLAIQPSQVPSGGASSSPVLVPSLGWLVERMLETCCYVRDMSYESPLLINFDKRQYVNDLVKVCIQHQRSLRPGVSNSVAQTSSCSALTSWLGQSAGPGTSFALKLVREAAQREFQTQKAGSNGQLPLVTEGHPNNGSNNNVSSSSSASTSSKTLRSTKIFSRLVSQQQEKVKRDQKEYERLDKQIKDTQGRIQKAQQEQAKTLEKQIKLEQSRSRVKNQLLKSTLMRAMRPISLAITSSWSSATTTVSNATALGSAISGKVMGATNELMGTSAAAAAAAAAAGGIAGGGGASLTTRDMLQRCGAVGASGKPALVINLINSTCSVAYTYTKRDYVFKIVTEEGGQSLLQALDYEDMLKWIRVMNEAAAEATAKRRTLLDIDESLQLSKEDAMEVAVVEPEKKGRNSVFGVELRHLMSDGNVPMIVEKCITEIEKRGLEEVGIYRVPGAVSAINKLRLCFNSGIKYDELDLESDEWKDINVVAGALKQFLRELPEAVTTSQLYDGLIAASALEDYDERLMTMKDLIRTLPPANYLLLKRIIEHLERVTDYEEINHMYATNLAIVFGPTLLRPGGSSATSFATSMKNLGHQQSIVRNMILQYHWLFDVEDEEGEGDGQQGAGEGEAEAEGQLEELNAEEDDEEDEESEFPEILDDSDEDDNEEQNENHGQQQVEDTIFAFMSAPPPPATVETISSADTSLVGRGQVTKDQRRKTIVFK